MDVTKQGDHHYLCGRPRILGVHQPYGSVTKPGQVVNLHIPEPCGLIRSSYKQRHRVIFGGLSLASNALRFGTWSNTPDWIKQGTHPKVTVT